MAGPSPCSPAASQSMCWGLKGNAGMGPQVSSCEDEAQITLVGQGDQHLHVMAGGDVVGVHSRLKDDKLQLASYYVFFLNNFFKIRVTLSSVLAKFCSLSSWSPSAALDRCCFPSFPASACPSNARCCLTAAVFQPRGGFSTGLGRALLVKGRC